MDINNSDDDYNKAYREAVKEAGFKDGEKYLLSGYVYSVEKYEDTYSYGTGKTRK